MNTTIPWSQIPKEPSKWKCKPGKNPPILVLQESAANLCQPSTWRTRTTNTLKLCLGGLIHRKLKSRHNCQSNTTSYKEQDLSPEVYHILVQVSPGRDNTAICSCKNHSASNTQIWHLFVLFWGGFFVFKKWYEVKLQTTRTLLTHGYLGKWGQMCSSDSVF